MVSIQRLSDYLGAAELQPDARKTLEARMLQIGDEAGSCPRFTVDCADLCAQVLSIKDADFSWTSTVVQPTLEGINLSVRKGELVGVYGKVCHWLPTHIPCFSSYISFFRLELARSVTLHMHEA